MNATKQLGPQMAKLVASSKRGEGQFAPVVANNVVQEANATQDRVAKLLSAVQGTASPLSSRVPLTLLA